MRSLRASATIMVLRVPARPSAVRERYQAIPEPVLRQPDLMAVLLRTLRGDFTLVEDYRYHATARLACPITAFGGRDDRRITREQVAA